MRAQSWGKLELIPRPYQWQDDGLVPNGSVAWVAALTVDGTLSNLTVPLGLPFLWTRWA